MSTHYGGAAAERRALNTFINLMRAANSVTNRLSAGFVKAGLTTGQFGVLETLLHIGPLCQKELAAKLLVSGGNITMVVDNLEKRKFVRRVRAENDRRYVTVELTPAGRAFIGGLFPQHAAAIAREFEILNPSEQEILRQLCRMVGKQQRNKKEGSGK